MSAATRYNTDIHAAFRKLSHAERLAKVEECVRVACRKYADVTAVDVATALGVSIETTTNLLRELSAAGRLEATPPVSEKRTGSQRRLFRAAGNAECNAGCNVS